MSGAIDPPDTLIAELTYRCPLACGYCSNPVAYESATLGTTEWLRILDEAAELGVLQLHFTGGEPLLRPDLETLIRAARTRQLYVNLVTSGVPLSLDRLKALVDAGTDHVQLSLQSARAELSDAIAGTTAFVQKLAVADWVTQLDVPLTINVVLHRQNIDEVGEIVALAASLGAHRVELANTQYLGWALHNRAGLLPSEAQVARARVVAAEGKERHRGRMEVVFVLPDYLAGRPRACMSGWARRYVVIAPDGRVLPCQAAHALAGLDWERVGRRHLAAIWRDSPSLERFRGQAWMPEPCRSCDERERDFGGCRCQAFALTGDASATDPACARSPQHELIRAARASAAEGPASVVRRHLHWLR